MAKKAVIQLRAKTMDKVKQGYARVVQWKDIMYDHPQKLKISPIAAIPHKSKPYRAILDLSFHMTCNGVQFKSVNAATTKQAPPEAMVQLGQTLPRLVHLMAANYNLQ